MPQFWKKGLSQLREVHVTFEDYKRLVPLENDTYEALVDGFITTFKDVLPVSEDQARDMVLFRKYNRKFKDFVDIKPCESIAGITNFQATLVGSTTIIGRSYPLFDNNIYNLCSFGSYQGNGFLRRENEQTLKADGDGKTRECEWLAHEVKTPKAIYWIFSNDNNTKVLAIKNGQVVLEDSGSAGTSGQFVSSLNGRYHCFSPRGDTQGNFIGVDGAGAVTVITNTQANPGNKYNPTPQTLFIPYFLREKAEKE